MQEVALSHPVSNSFYLITETTNYDRNKAEFEIDTNSCNHYLNFILIMLPTIIFVPSIFKAACWVVIGTDFTNDGFASVNNRAV